MYVASRVARRDRIIQNGGTKCQFCRSSNMDRKTLTCKDCGTTTAMDLGANQRVDKHGNPIIAKIANSKEE